MNKKSVGAKKSAANKQPEVMKSAKVCPPCKPCAPIWPVILLTVAGVAAIGASTWQWWGKGWVREKIVQEECPDICSSLSTWTQTSVPVFMTTGKDAMVLALPNGMKIDLPKNDEGGTDYEVEATYFTRQKDGELPIFHETTSYRAMITGPEMTPHLEFEMYFADFAGEPKWPTEEELKAKYTVEVLGKTKGGHNILLVTDGADVQGVLFDIPYVSNVGSNLGEGEPVWRFSSGRYMDAMSEAEYKAMLKILKTLR